MQTEPATEPRPRPVRIRTRVQCVECERVFDLTNSDDQEEWTYGHDCEA